MRSPLLVAMMASPKASHLIFDVVSAAVQEVFNAAVVVRNRVKIVFIIFPFDASADTGTKCRFGATALVLGALQLLFCGRLRVRLLRWPPLSAAQVMHSVQSC